MNDNKRLFLLHSRLNMVFIIFLLFTLARLATGQNSAMSTGVTICPPSNMDDACTKMFDNLIYVVTGALPVVSQSTNMDNNITKPMTNTLLMPLNSNMTKICCFLSQFQSANQACCRQIYKYCSPWTSTMCTTNGCPANGDNNMHRMAGDKNVSLFHVIKCSAMPDEVDCRNQAVQVTDVNNLNYDVNQFINEAVGWVKKKMGVD